MIKKYINYIIYSVYTVFIIVSLITDFHPGRMIFDNFISFAVSMLKILPAAFLIIGLFEVWVKKETVEKHLGSKSSIIAYFWVILLAGTTVGGMYVAFPISAVLYRKGARLSVILAYLASSAVFRIPMCIFEASFLGIKFTMLRFAVSLPLIIISSELLARYLKNTNTEKELYRENSP